ncbi:Permease of the drug/metabolite transporter (DMT) superfamily [Desulfosporosinus sp. I2]|nr:Permease of the drug/metabolite transporter (DMT) superfamily [Desulfosporosinus sp. I2]
MPNIKVISKRRPSRVDAKASITLLISNNYIAIFPSVFSFIFWNMSIRAIGISQAGIFLNLIPVFTAIISWI